MLKPSTSASGQINCSVWTSALGFLGKVKNSFFEMIQGGWRNVSFLENLQNVLNNWSLSKTRSVNVVNVLFTLVM